MAKPNPQPRPQSPAPARPDHHGPKLDHPDERKRPRWRRRLFRLGCFLLLLAVVVVVAGPKLLSTGPGTRLLLAQVNSRVDGHLEVDDLSLSWFSGLHASGVKYTAHNGGHEVTAGRVDLHDTSLWALATGDRALGRIVVKNLHGETIEPRDVPTDDRAPSTGNDKPAGTPADDGPGLLHGVSFELQVDGLSWRYHAPDIEPVDLVSSELALSLPGDGGARLRVDGALTQGEESGSFDLALDADGLLDPEGRLQLGLADFTVDASAPQVPVDALARLLSGRTYNNKALAYVLGTPERVSSLLGGRWLAGEVKAAGTLEELDALVRIHTDHLDADLALTSAGGTLSAGEATTLRLEVTPQAVAALNPGRGLVLDAPVVLACEWPRFEVPVVDGAVVKEAMVLRAVVNSGDWSLTDTDGRRVTLASPKLGLAGETLGEELVAALESVVTVTDAGGAAAQSPADGTSTEPAQARLRITQMYSGQPVYAYRMTNAPTAVAEWLYGGAGGLAAAVGPVVQSVVGRVDTADGRAGGGTLAVNWDTDEQAPMPGALAVMPPVAFAIDPQGLVTLPDGQDIEMRLVVTEALGDHWLGQVNPILFDAKSGDRPVRIVVDGETFAYPLGDPDFAGALVDATLDLGTVRFGGESLFAKIFEWTGHADEPARFLPASVTLRGGELRYDELGLELGNVQVRFQGAVDLVGKTLAEMSMRVPSESLVKVFQDLEDVVEPGDELIIPMRGGIRTPEVDMDAFQAEIVRLMTAAPRRELERELGRLGEMAREAVGGEVGDEAGELIEGALRRFFGGRGGDDE